MNVANEAVTGRGPHGEHGGHAGHGGHGPTHMQYITGFALAVLLTAIPFALVIGHVVKDVLLVITVCAAAQIIVHVVYFLHLNRSEEQRWNRMALLYVVIMVGIVLGGSLWIMYSLNHNMMPGMMHSKVWK
ncbi:cytochrome o ubiquinol oxidase subunit IV [mine drainage metagenome]|uniref:Cytochrome o ubiquinol oxidase subunit IV n=1 Tax=mine drainage metagenome TaxID=410659 RepID=T0YIS0_9ZZZZ